MLYEVCHLSVFVGQPHTHWQWMNRSIRVSHQRRKKSHLKRQPSSSINMYRHGNFLSSQADPAASLSQTGSWGSRLWKSGFLCCSGFLKCWVSQGPRQGLKMQCQGKLSCAFALSTRKACHCHLGSLDEDADGQAECMGNWKRVPDGKVACETKGRGLPSGIFFASSRIKTKPRGESGEGKVPCRCCRGLDLNRGPVWLWGLAW